MRSVTGNCCPAAVAAVAAPVWPGEVITSTLRCPTARRIPAYSCAGPDTRAHRLRTEMRWRVGRGSLRAWARCQRARIAKARHPELGEIGEYCFYATRLRFG